MRFFFIKIQVDSNAAIRCNEVLMDWPEGKNDFFMKNSNDLDGAAAAAHAMQFPPMPDSTTPKLVNDQQFISFSLLHIKGN